MKTHSKISLNCYKWSGRKENETFPGKKIQFANAANVCLFAERKSIKRNLNEISVERSATTGEPPEWPTGLINPFWPAQALGTLNMTNAIEVSPIENRNCSKPFCVRFHSIFPFGYWEWTAVVCTGLITFKESQSQAPKPRFECSPIKCECRHRWAFPLASVWCELEWVGDGLQIK